MHQETDKELEIQKPNPADVVHCILYVIKSTTNLKSMPKSMESMIELLKEQHSEGNSGFFIEYVYILVLIIASALYNEIF